MSTPLWTRSEIEVATGVSVSKGVLEASGVSIDTRTLAPGDLFFAIKGNVFDGHDFVADAIKKHASAVFVSSDKISSVQDSNHVIVVPDVLDSLRRLAFMSRARSKAKIVAITGSVGKTGTKEALRLALSRQGRTHASVASYNNHWGVPLTLSRMPHETDFGVFEIGMNHANEILPLTEMVSPHVAVITTVEPVHMEFFPSLWGIADAKSEIFFGLEPGGTAILNGDTPYAERLFAHAFASNAGQVITFGERQDANIRAKRIIVRPDSSVVEASIFDQPLVYRIGTGGRHIALNSLSVLAAVHALGGDVSSAALALEDLKSPVGRGERTILSIGDREALLIDESYNANPASVRAALSNLGAVHLDRKGRRIAVLGDMKELGKEGPELHKALAAEIKMNNIDVLFAAGPLMENLVAHVPMAKVAVHVASSVELIGPVCAFVHPCDVVMVKGSLSMKMGLVVKALKERYGAEHSPTELKDGLSC